MHLLWNNTTGGVFLREKSGLILAGIAAGAVNGIFGGGGGMVLVPLLTLMTSLPESAIFPASVCIILPICLTSLGITALTGKIPWCQALPYLIGSAGGGILAGLWGKKIPVKWLHRGLGILILWGGIRYLW